MTPTYFDLILRERGWSWTLIGVGYLVITLFVRQIIFGNIARELRAVDPDFYSAVKKLYLRTSLGGWVFFLMSFILLIAVWMGWRFPFVNGGTLVLFCLLLPLLFCLSVISHLRAFTRAIVLLLRQRMGPEKEF